VDQSRTIPPTSLYLLRPPSELAAASSHQCYVAYLLDLYLALPDTPSRSHRGDSTRARQWFIEGVPLATVETALLLASLRRCMRPSTRLGVLGRIRSLAYFQPVVDELIQQPPQPGYLDHLRRKLADLTGSRP
jgi:hypothetical protein